MTVQQLINALNHPDIDKNLNVYMHTKWTQGGKADEIREPVMALDWAEGPGGGETTVLMLMNWNPF